MPQASDELNSKFEDDRVAWEVLKENFNDNKGLISPKVVGYKMTEHEGDAIDYLCGEWDYAYSPTGKWVNEGQS